MSSSEKHDVAALHPLHVADASLQLHLHSRIIASYKQSLLRHVPLSLSLAFSSLVSSLLPSLLWFLRPSLMEAMAVNHYHMKTIANTE